MGIEAIKSFGVPVNIALPLLLTRILLFKIQFKLTGATINWQHIVTLVAKGEFETPLTNEICVTLATLPLLPAYLHTTLLSCPEHSGSIFWLIIRKVSVFSRKFTNAFITTYFSSIELLEPNLMVLGLDVVSVAALTPTPTTLNHLTLFSA